MPLPDDEIITRECQIERTPPELRRWADEQLTEISRTDAGKSAIRMRRGVAKQFIEEVYPLSLWATRVYADRQDVRCRSVLGNQPYDAVITDFATTPHRESYLEITQANDGYDDHLRMEYMERHGGVSMIGKPQRSGSRAERKIEVPFEAAGQGTLIGNACRQVRAALEMKAAKAYGSHTSLLVMMDDVYFEWDCDYADLNALLLDFASIAQPRFDAINVLGWQGRVAVKLLRDTPDGAWCVRKF